MKKTPLTVRTSFSNCQPIAAVSKANQQTIQLGFDRGTILIRADDSSIKLPAVANILWDERVRSYRAPASCYRELMRYFSAHNFAIRDLTTHRWGDAMALSVPNLRSYQQASLNAWRERKGRGVIVLPTGAGKTVVGIAAIALTKKPAICLVPTRILLEQWRERLLQQFRMPIGILGDGKQELAPVMVATFESAYRYMNWIGNRFQLLIVDEVHHFGSGMRDEALEMCIAPFRLGLTATPIAKSEVRKRLAELIGPQVYEATVNELTGRYLAPFEHVTIHVELYPDERAAYDREIGLFRAEFDKFSRSFPGSRWLDFAAWAKVRPEGRRALLGLRQARRIIGASRAKEESLEVILSQNGRSKTLIFTSDTDSAYRISRKMLVAAVTGDIKKKEREEVLEKFKKGVLNILVSCRVLNEGIDVPDAEIAIVLGGNHGEREHIQRIGRCLRPSPNKVAKVYELVAKNTIEIRNWQKRTESLAPRSFA
jgi:superfamily II DNA or RNA helicase